MWLELMHNLDIRQLELIGITLHKIEFMCTTFSMAFISLIDST